MAWPASGPGRLLERCGDVAPRGMTVHDKTRLIGRLRRFFRHDEKSPRVCSANLGPRATSAQFPAAVAAPPLLKGGCACRRWRGAVVNLHITVEPPHGWLPFVRHRMQPPVGPCQPPMGWLYRASTVGAGCIQPAHPVEPPRGWLPFVRHRVQPPVGACQPPMGWLYRASTVGAGLDSTCTSGRATPWVADVRSASRAATRGRMPATHGVALPCQLP